MSQLSRAIDSVLAQTRPVEEIIVVDDGSIDETHSLILTKYPQITLILQNNQGVSSARNQGIHKASGDWLAFLDSDDEWLPEKIEQQFLALNENPGHQVIHSDEIWIRQGVRVNPMKKHKKYGGDIFKYCLPLCCISPSSVMIHKSIFGEVGMFDEDLPACEDYDLWLRICCRYPVLFIEQPLIIKYGGHVDQLSKQYWGMDRFRIQALDNLIAADILNLKQTRHARSELVKKTGIFLQGAKKYNNQGSIEHYTKLLEKHSL